ncbi:MAG: biotin--[acetyl-CoA-carboxylase] ligase [Fusicatenibacter sp.]
MQENKKAETLRLLREAEDNISGQYLCEHFGISRTAIWKIMNQLKEEGYEIEAVQNRGYRLVGQPDLLGKDELESRMSTNSIGRCVYYKKEIDSTNTWAKRLAEEGVPDGTLVVADTQNAGKGRRGRSWNSPEGTSISMTLLLYPDLEPAKAPMLTIVMGLSVVQGIRNALGVDTKIKWPNDAVLNGRKLCGILTEMSAQIDFINYVVIGTGINVNQEEFPEEIRDIATSLLIETGRRVNRAGIIAAVMEAFEKNYEAFKKTGDLSAMQKDYEEVLVNKNQQVRVLDPKEPFEGVALGITATGELRVQKEDGTIREIHSGEVSVRGLYSYV